MDWVFFGSLDLVEDVYSLPLRAIDRVGAGEWRLVVAGYVLVIWSPVFVVDGVLRLDGVVKIGVD